MAQMRGIRIHQHLDDWLCRAPCLETCRRHTQTLLAWCRELGWVVNMKKSELTPQQDFNFIGYRFDLLTSRDLPTQERWLALQQKLKFVKSKESCMQTVHVPDRMTYSHRKAGLVRSTSMRPIQWHLKQHWHAPEILDKVILIPMSLHPHLDWWLNKEFVFRGQPLHPLGLTIQMFTDTSNKGWGAHLGDSTARGLWSDT